MKTSFKYCALATIAILLYSCNKEITPDTIESQVQISAKITPRIVTRVTDDGTAFSNGDAIKVQNLDRESKNLATYTYSSSTGTWSTSDELYWDGESENTFNAWYPVDADYSSFTIPSDQTTGTAAADWMTATTSAKKADGKVELSFNHNLAKVTVVIEKWSNEYTTNEKVVNSLELKSLSSTISNDGNLSGDNVAKWIKTSVSQANISYVALIAPGTYPSAADIMQVYVNGAATALKVKTTSTVVVESGKAYNFKLTIGKDHAIISSSITVGEWDNEALDNQQTTAEVTKKIDYIDEYGINHGKGVEIDGVIWAPVNCGYHATDYKYGKLYQWGRKYGQGYIGNLYDNDYDVIGVHEDAVMPTIKTGGISPEACNTLDNANVFFTTSSDLGYNWSTDTNSNLWNSGTIENPTKTEYDPCPDGWRVPTLSEISNLKRNASGWLSSTSILGKRGYSFSGSQPYTSDVPQIFLPATGSLNYTNGKAGGRGNEGNYWCSKTDGTYSCYLYFDYSIIQTNGSVGRAQGYSVRCVHE